MKTTMTLAAFAAALCLGGPALADHLPAAHMCPAGLSASPSQMLLKDGANDLTVASILVKLDNEAGQRTCILQVSGGYQVVAR